MKINTKAWWDQLFASGNWEAEHGRKQTRRFAKAQVRYFKISPDFDGTIVDFGCGLGDAMPVYRSAFRNAKLIGVDISDSAIDLCRRKYGHIAQFMQGDHTSVPLVDVIIASNVFEHLDNDREVAAHLAGKCKDLYILVPYKEDIVPGDVHVNSYDENYFRDVGRYDWCILSRGWSQYTLKYLLYHMYFKNLFRPFFGKKIVRRGKRIVFHFKSTETTKRENV